MQVVFAHRFQRPRATWRQRRGLWAAALVAALGVLQLPAVARATGQVGEPAANFTKTDATGVVHTLDQYRGKVVVLFVMGWG